MSVIALVHIGSASVSGGLLSDKKLIFATEHECRFTEKLDSKMFLGDVADALKLVMQDLLNAKFGSPSKVIVFLSAPFVAGQLQTLKQENQNKFKVTESLIWDLVSRETNKYKTDKQHTVIDSKIMRFYLNGYEIAEPHGQQAQSLEVAHYLSISASEVIAKFKNVIKSACHHEQIEWHSASFANYLLVRDWRPKDEGFLLLDIGGELTELSLVWQGIIRESFSFPLGGHAALRQAVASGESRSSGRSALELKHEKSTKILEKKVDKTEQEWVNNFKTGLEQVLHNKFWSGEIILLTEDPAWQNLFGTWLEHAELGKIIFNTGKISVIPLTSDLLNKLVKVESGVKASVNLLVSSLFVLKI
ncbi:MAG: hypothetical protein AAB364_01220 [Patescibacteria group bacterium]